jgi:hypothetical protein
MRPIQFLTSSTGQSAVRTSSDEKVLSWYAVTLSASVSEVGLGELEKLEMDGVTFSVSTLQSAELPSFVKFLVAPVLMAYWDTVKSSATTCRTYDSTAERFTTTYPISTITAKVEGPDCGNVSISEICPITVFTPKRNMVVINLTVNIQAMYLGIRPLKTFKYESFKKLGKMAAGVTKLGDLTARLSGMSIN